MRTIPELQASVASWKGYIAKDLAWELCGSCPLKVCDKKASGCQVRQWVCEQRRRRYRENAVKFRQKANQIYAANPERYKAKQADYYRESKDVIMVKRDLRKQRKLQEGATQC